MGSYQTVIVGTDGSESSFRAVDKAAAVAKDAGATLVIACAYTPSRDGGEQSGTMRGAWKSAKPHHSEPGASDVLGEESYKVAGSSPAESVLQDASDRARKVGVNDKDIKTDAVAGDPVDALVDLVGKHKADLIIVGNRGLNSLAGRLLGSVPANVSHRASCDVLIVHTTG
ncbi:MAG: universal stress protein [Actinomycetes bacterium]